MSLSPLKKAIIQTVTYADIFSYPLTLDEIHNYLVGIGAACGEVEAAVCELVPHHIEAQDGFFVLPGAAGHIRIRAQRADFAAQQWALARTYGAWIGRLPFVRMVAVTGALAVNNAPPDDDIDYLIITQPGRLWLTRAMVIALVKVAARRGHVICPNFFLTEDNLAIPDHNLFTAHELMQMIPLSGWETYQAMLAQNQWVHEFLPNAAAHAPLREGQRQHLKRWAEALLRLPPVNLIEGWEMRRKVKKLTRQMQQLGIQSSEARFTASCCRGHFHQHGQHTLSQLNERLP